MQLWQCVWYGQERVCRQSCQAQFNVPHQLPLPVEYSPGTCPKHHNCFLLILTKMQEDLLTSKGIKKSHFCFAFTAQQHRHNTSFLPLSEPDQPKEHITKTCRFSLNASCTAQLIKNRQKTVAGNMDADHLPFTVLLQIVMLAILVLLLRSFFCVFFSILETGTFQPH